MSVRVHRKNHTIITTVILCLTYLLLTAFYYHIDKHLTGITFALCNMLIVVSFLLIVFRGLKALFYLLRNYQNVTPYLITGGLVCLLTLAYSILSPYQFNSEQLESEVVLRACYEGTQNQSYVKFRKSKAFEMNWTGVFGYDEWWTGNWRRSGDTLFLKYDNKKIKQFGDTIVIANGYLNPLHQVTGKQTPKQLFYLGFCRHEN